MSDAELRALLDSLTKGDGITPGPWHGCKSAEYGHFWLDNEAGDSSFPTPDDVAAMVNALPSLLDRAEGGSRAARIVTRLPRMLTEEPDYSWVPLGDVLVALMDPDAAEAAWPESAAHLDTLQRWARLHAMYDRRLSSRTAPNEPQCECDFDDSDEAGDLPLCAWHEKMLRHLRWETLAAMYVDLAALVHATSVIVNEP